MEACRLIGNMLETTVQDEITLTGLDMRHAQNMYDFIVRNKAFFIEWIPFVSRIHRLQDMETLIKTNLERSAQGLGLYYTLWDHTTLIGYILARDIDREAKWAEIGYMIDKQYAGRGIIKASCIRLMKHLFNELHMDKVVICCTDDNAASQALAHTLGFTLEGTLRNHFVVNGTLRNMSYYGILREEYSREQGSPA